MKKGVNPSRIMLQDIPPDGLAFQMSGKNAEAWLKTLVAEALGQASVDTAAKTRSPAIDDSLSMDLLVSKDEAHIDVQGDLAFRAELSCSRCLEPYWHAFKLRMALPLLPASASPDKDLQTGEISLRGQDLETAYYPPSGLDLPALLREQILLAMPLKPLCKDACLGLCAQCGTNLNAGRCACTPAPKDPRFAVLKNLKIKH